jgi:hypothetical protein
VLTWVLRMVRHRRWNWPPKGKVTGRAPYQECYPVTVALREYDLLKVIRETAATPNPAAPSRCHGRSLAATTRAPADSSSAAIGDERDKQCCWNEADHGPYTSLQLANRCCHC